jgi:uncharacterized membrane protein AbrB (regulator of aidB expression)
MKYATCALIAVGLSGCVTTAGIVRKQNVSLPLLIGATIADLVVTSVVASQIEDASTAGTVTTGVAFTAADVVAGCLIGACSSLRL